MQSAHWFLVMWEPVLKRAYHGSLKVFVLLVRPRGESDFLESDYPLWNTDRLISNNTNNSEQRVQENLSLPASSIPMDFLFWFYGTIGNHRVLRRIFLNSMACSQIPENTPPPSCKMDLNNLNKMLCDTWCTYKVQKVLLRYFKVLNMEIAQWR